jgi:hypothetical protein
VSNTVFLVTYVEGCAKGVIGLGECGPVWQLGLIAGLLIAAILALAAIRLRAVSASGVTS